MSLPTLVTETNVKLGLRVRRSLYYNGGFSREGKGTVVGFMLGDSAVGRSRMLDIGSSYSCMVEWDVDKAIYNYCIDKGNSELQLDECLHDWIEVDHPDFPCTMCKICNEVMEAV